MTWLTRLRGDPAYKLMATVIHTLRRRYAIFAAASAILALIGLVPPKFFVMYSDLVATDGDAFMTFAVFGLLVAFTVFFLSLGGNLIDEWMMLAVETDLKRRALNRVHELSLEELDGLGRGDWLTRMTGDLTMAEGFLTHSLLGLLRGLLTYVAVIALLSYEQAWVAVLLIVASVPMVLLNLWAQRHSFSTLMSLRAAHGNILQGLIESFEGLRTIRTQQAEQAVLARFEERLRYVRQGGLRVVRNLGAFAGANAAFGQLVITACLCMAMWNQHSGAMTLTQALAYPFYLGLYQSACVMIAGFFQEWMSYRVEGGRIAEFLIRATAGEAEAEPIVMDVDAAASVSSVALKDLVVSHATTGPLTLPFDLCVRKGELLVIKGASGCGKSTLLEILAGLRPVRCRQMTMKQDDGAAHILERRFGSEASALSLPLQLSVFVEQRPYMFSGTVWENITLGSSTAVSQVDAWQALASLRLADWVQSIGGLDAKLADQGSNVSEGQRYRLALVRALIAPRPFILLDEPFAALDRDSVDAVCAMLRDLREQHGIVVVSHVEPPGLDPDRVLDFETVEVSPKQRLQYETGESHVERDQARKRH